MIKRNKGLTLAELLVSFIIIATIIGIALPNTIKRLNDVDTISFTNELKTLENNIKIVSEVYTDNYGHLPHPAFIDYNEVESGLFKPEDGIPFNGLDTSDPQYYYQINLNGSAAGTVQKMDGSGEITSLVYTFETALEKKYGNSAILKAFPIDLYTFTKFSPTPLSMSFPANEPYPGLHVKTNYDYYTLNKYQTGEVFNDSNPTTITDISDSNYIPDLPLEEVFVGTVTTGTGTDANDRIPNDGIEEKGGFYILVEYGGVYTIFYTGTDAIYQNKYIHTY